MSAPASRHLRLSGKVQEPDVHLYYRPAEKGHLCVVTVPADEDERFVVTAVFHQEHQAGERTMEKLRVYYDREGNTLSVWFDDPKKESVCEEADDDMVLVKDSDGRVIGFERLNYLSAKQLKDGVSIPVEVQMV